MERVKNIISQLPKQTVYDIIPSPAGHLLLLATDYGLQAVLWQHELESSLCDYYLKTIHQSPTQQIIMQANEQLTQYFNGTRKHFSIPLSMNGTAFQKQAWNVLLTIPFASTVSYGEQAKQLGNKNKARAVGMANNLNPISIIIPCHRVIGSNGSLVGFGGGLEAKAWLLHHETKSK